MLREDHDKTRSLVTFVTLKRFAVLLCILAIVLCSELKLQISSKIIANLRCFTKHSTQFFICYTDSGVPEVSLKAPSICKNWPAAPLPDQSVWKSIGLFQQFLLKKHFFGAHYLEFDWWSGWSVLIKGEILIATGMVWLVSSDKWKEL